jgi:hypothetical protein
LSGTALKIRDNPVHKGQVRVRSGLAGLIGRVNVGFGFCFGDRRGFGIQKIISIPSVCPVKQLTFGLTIIPIYDPQFPSK